MLQFVPAGIAMLFYSPGLKPSFIRTKSSIQNLILRLFSAFELEDPVESIGAKLERQAASKSNDLAGDGTITSVVLVQGLIAEGVKVLATGANPVQITRGIEKSVKALVAELKLMSKEVEDSELADVGAVTAGNNNEIGSMIAEAMGKVGRKGVVTLEEGKSSENNVYVVEGMQFDRSYIFPYFITDSEKMAVEYDNCKLLLVDMKILNARDLVSVLEDAIRGGYPILVIAEDIEAEALAPFVVNKLRGSFKIAVVKAPGFGERKSQYLDDIAILTAATVIRVSLDKAENEVLGHAAKVVLNKETTTIVGDGSTQDAVNKRVAQIRNLIEAADQDYEKEKLNERIAKLLGGAAVIQAKRMDVVWGETTGVEGNCCFCHPYYSHCRGLKHTSGSCYYSKLH